MINFVFAAAALFFLPGPAWAGSPYLSFEGGISAGRASDADELAQYSPTATSSNPATPPDEEFDDVFSVGYDNGLDVGIAGGYDFGLLRLELELAHKQASLGDITPDENLDAFLASFNSALNRPTLVSNSSEPGLPALTASDFPLEGKMHASSAMANGLFDVELVDGVTGYAGGGLGRSRVRALNDRDAALAWQWIAGVRYAANPRIELGVKYRYFNSGIVKLRHPDVTYSGNAQDGQTISATLKPEIEGEIRTRSLLTTLTLKL